MQEPERPDGTYAQWRGATCRARFVARPKGTVRLYLEQPAEIPPGFEARGEGEYAGLVPKSELTALFELQTYCLWKGERCRVTQWHPDGRIQLEWTRSNQPIGLELGFQTFERGIFIVTVGTSEVTDLHQEREDIPLN
jgi:hypothetical protein